MPSPEASKPTPSTGTIVESRLQSDLCANAPSTTPENNAPVTCAGLACMRICRISALDPHILVYRTEADNSMATYQLALTLLCVSVLAGPVAAHGLLEDRLALVDRAIAADPQGADCYLRRAELRIQAGNLVGAWVDLDVYETLLRRIDETLLPSADDPVSPDDEPVDEPVSPDDEPKLPSIGDPLLPSVVALPLPSIDEPITPGLGRPTASRSGRLLRAQLLEAMDALDRARAQLDTLLQENPNDPLGLRARAELLRRSDDPGGAARDYARAYEVSTELDPDLMLCWARTLVALGSPTDALAALDAAEQRFGAVPVLLLEGAEIERHRGSFPQALERLDRLERVSPGSALNLATRARTLRQAGRIDEARKVYAAALSTLEHSSIARRSTRASQALASELRAEVETLR